MLIFLSTHDEIFYFTFWVQDVHFNIFLFLFFKILFNIENILTKSFFLVSPMRKSDAVHYLASKKFI